MALLIVGACIAVATLGLVAIAIVEHVHWSLRVRRQRRRRLRIVRLDRDADLVRDLSRAIGEHEWRC